MEPASPTLAAAVLCGGESRRMGADKWSVRLDGETLLQRAVRRLSTVADPVIVAGGSRRLEHAGCPTVLDEVPRCGPVGGLVAALRASPHPLMALVAVDMPDCQPRLLLALAAAWAGEDAVVPVSVRGPEPLHAVYSRSALPAAAAAQHGADRSVRSLLGALRVRTIDAREVLDRAAAGRFAANLNRPEDLAARRREGA